MNRRDFFKTASAVTVTAMVAPAALLQKPEFYPEGNCPITLKMLQDAYAQVTFNYPHPNLFIPEAFYDHL